MKKGITMLLVLALSAMMLVGCGSGVAGTYKLTKAEVNGKEMEMDALTAMMGQKFEVTVTLQEDGKVLMESNMPGQVQKETGTWKEDGDKIVIKEDKGGEESILTVDGDKLYADGGNGMKLILQK